jgi:hypothetical protein
LFIWLKSVNVVLKEYLCMYVLKGCFVPADKIRLGLMDKLFVKIHTGMFYIVNYMTVFTDKYFYRYSFDYGSVEFFA